jgi:hypothetical protein
MNNEVNGNDVKAAGNEQSKAATEHAQKIAQLNVAARQVIGVLVRGLMVSAPGVAPIENVCVAAFQYGAILGDCFEGDLVTILGLRKQMKDAFDKGMNSVTPSQATAPPADLIKRLNG